eukprot:2925399-Pleurochrysis_carterae.AAC.3
MPPFSVEAPASLSARTGSSAHRRTRACSRLALVHARPMAMPLWVSVRPRGAACALAHSPSLSRTLTLTNTSTHSQTSVSLPLPLSHTHSHKHFHPLRLGIEFDENGPQLISQYIKKVMKGMDVSVLMGANVANEGADAMLSTVSRAFLVFLQGVVAVGAAPFN